MNKDVITAREVSYLLNVTVARVYDLTRERKIPFVRIGNRQYRYLKSKIEAWIANGGNAAQEVIENER